MKSGIQGNKHMVTGLSHDTKMPAGAGSDRLSP